jgi:hypothetical protein
VYTTTKYDFKVISSRPVTWAEHIENFNGKENLGKYCEGVDWCSWFRIASVDGLLFSRVLEKGEVPDRVSDQ